MTGEDATWGIVMSTGEPPGDEKVGEEMDEKEMLDDVLKR